MNERCDGKWKFPARVKLHRRVGETESWDPQQSHVMPKYDRINSAI